MSTFLAFPVRRFVVPLCCWSCCLACKECSAWENASGCLVMSLDQMRITEVADSQRCEAEIDLLVSNRCDRTLCVLPSEFWLGYLIQYRNGEFDHGGAGSSTMSSGAKQVSDLHLPTVVVKRGEVGRLRVTLKSVSRPKGTAGRLNLEFQCRPYYKGDAYRGVPLYRHLMRLKTEVVVLEHERTKEWTIRAVKPQSSPGTSEEGASGGNLRKPRSGLNSGRARVSDAVKSFQGIWELKDRFTPDGTRSLAKERWHFQGNNILIYQVKPTGDELVGWYYITISPKADPKQINLVARRVPPREARPLTNEERAGVGKNVFNGIYRFSKETLNIYFPARADCPRPTSIPTKGTEKKHVHCILKLKYRAGEYE